MKYFDVVFDGPPGPEAGRFVEVEDDAGQGISLGEWVKRADGYWALRVTRLSDAEARAEAAEKRVAELEAALEELTAAANEVDRAQWKSSAERAHAMANMNTVLERHTGMVKP